MSSSDSIGTDSRGASASQPDPGLEGDSLVVVLVTAPPDQAEDLATNLLEDRLIACANVVMGNTSIYRWQGKTERDREAVLVLKTTDARLQELERRVTELHPYDLPEFLALPVLRASPAYADWVRSEVMVAEPS